MPTILREIDRADILGIRLNRPQVRNAIDQAMVDELHALCDELEGHPRILVISGGDGVFASGADIAELRDRTPDDARAGINLRVFDRIASLPLPVIAAVDGWALGGGAELTYAADLRVASDRARFGNPEPSLGIVAAAGATWRLPALVGLTLAKDMLLTGRVLDAQEALVAGLVRSVHAPGDLDDAALALAERVAALDPLALTHTKRLVAASGESDADHRNAIGAAQAECFASPEKHRRMTAFLEGGRS